MFQRIPESFAARWFSASCRRVSIRSYTGSPGPEQFEALASFLAEAEPLCQQGVRIVLGRGPVFARSIQGTDAFAALYATKDSSQADPSLGWAGEALALECAARGLGTCWIGSSMKRNAVLELCPPKEGETLRCILAIGQCCLPEKPIYKRKSLSKSTGLSDAALSVLPTWQYAALTCAQQAPTALNRQAWEARLSPDALAVRATGRNFGYGQIDLGIVLLHLVLGAQCTGWIGGLMETPPWYALSSAEASRP